jgi:monofunctional biosynthetic peptidoglycan transglycosylase
MTAPERGKEGAEASPDRAPASDAPLAAPAQPEARRGRAARRGGTFAAAAVALGWAFVVLFYGSILWVAAYRALPPPYSFVMLERRLAGAAISQEWTRLEDISPHLVRAVIAAEDSRFCRHQGLDFAAIDAALEERRNGARRRGASTISQQTAKNAFLWNGGGWLRKAAEAWFTLVVETLWPKRRIMEVYLNLAEWGDGNFGAAAAARARFKARAADLTREEAALLAAVLPSPNRWRAVDPGPYVRGRAATIRKRMEIVRRDGLDACVFAPPRK